MKTKIIAICGKSASGKDTLKRHLKDYEPFKGLMNEIVLDTTRPQRTSEVWGIDYNFLTDEEMAERIFGGHILVAENFNNWTYAIDAEALKEDAINIVVISPESIESLYDYKHLDITSVCVYEEDKVRLMRYLNRDGNVDIDEMFRRYKTDRSDYIGIESLVDFTGRYDDCVNYLACEIERMAEELNNVD